MSRRIAIIVSSLAVVLLVVALVWSGSRDEQRSSFSNDVPPVPVVAALPAGQEACQGPLQTLGPFRYLTFWVTPVAGPGPALKVTVREAYGSHSELSAGRVLAGYTGRSAQEPTLTRTVPSGHTVTICVRSAGPGQIDLIGDGRNSRSGVLTVDGRRKKDVLALYFVRPRPVSLLSQLPTIFTRAALFRPRWVGSWTFWVLAALLVGAFAGAVFAVRQAQRADARSSEQTEAQ